MAHWEECENSNLHVAPRKPPDSKLNEKGIIKLSKVSNILATLKISYNAILCEIALDSKTT